MNSILNQTYFVSVIQSYEDFSFISGYIVIPIICGISGLLNLIILVILMSLTLDQKAYDYLKYKSLNDMISCILAGSVTNALCTYCISYVFNTLGTLIYRVYFLRIFLEILYNTSIFCEIGLTYDRLCLIKGKTNWFIRMKVSYFYVVSLLLSLIIYLPEFMAFKITRFEDDIYMLSLTAIGNSTYYNYYYLILTGIQSFVSIICVTILNAQTFFSFKEFLRNKTTKQNIKKKKIKQENDTTKMIIILNFLFVISRIAFFIGTILPRVDNLNKIMYNPITNTYRYVQYYFLLSVYGINCLFVILYNKRIKNKLLTCLRKQKETIMSINSK